MRINLFKADALETQKQLVKVAINPPDDVVLDLALDSVHGLNELTRSLAQLHPHKKSIAVLGAQPPPLQQVVTGFAADGFSVQELPVSFTKPDATALKEAFDKLKKDTLFILGCAIEPLTAAFYPFDFIRAEAPKKNIFSVIYQSPDALKRGLVIPKTPWEGIVADPLWNDTHTLAVILKGDRCQGESLFWGKPHFSDSAIGYLSKTLSEIVRHNGFADIDSPEDEKAVKEFETRVSKKFGTTVELLGPETPRLFDRAVLFVGGVNGDSLVTNLNRIGFESFSGAACGWNDPHLNNWLPKLGISADKVQTSILLPVKTLRNPEFFDKFVWTVEELRKISGF